MMFGGMENLDPLLNFVPTTSSYSSPFDANAFSYNPLNIEHSEFFENDVLAPDASVQHALETTPVTISSNSPIPAGSEENQDSTKAGIQRRIRSHRKSRQGCYHCKRRKVKCPENKPFCDNCKRNGLRCVYPHETGYAQALVSGPSIPQVQAMKELHGSKLEYTALDMRLLHHFLVEAYPHLPLGCDEIWKYDVPGLAHHYPFLMSSLLAVAAAHLVRTGHKELLPAAYHHRLKAASGVNQALDLARHDKDEDDAILGACYALAFQNAHLNHDIASFFITVRSCVAALIGILKMKHRSRFSTGCGKGDYARHQDYMKRRLDGFPRINQGLIQGGLKNFEAIETLCVTDLEKSFYKSLSSTFEANTRSSYEGYNHYSNIYVQLGTMLHEDFQTFCNPDQSVLSIMQCYFLALQSCMVPIFCHEWEGRFRSDRKQPEPTDDNALIQLSRAIDSSLTHMQDQRLRQHLQWPIHVQNLMQTDSLKNRDLLEKSDSAEIIYDGDRWYVRRN